MKRRSFIKITGILSISAILPYALTNCSNDIVDNLAIPNELLQVMSKESILNIGKQYCSLFPDEANKEIIISYFSKNNNQKLIHTLITNDFISGKTVMINGWVLAKTEVRQCALFSLIN